MDAWCRWVVGQGWFNNLEAAKLDLLMAGADPSGPVLAAVVELRQRLDEFEGRLAAGALGPVPRAGAAPPI